MLTPEIRDAYSMVVIEGILLWVPYTWFFLYLVSQMKSRVDFFRHPNEGIASILILSFLYSIHRKWWKKFNRLSNGTEIVNMIKSINRCNVIRSYIAVANEVFRPTFQSIFELWLNYFALRTINVCWGHSVLYQMLFIKRMWLKLIK